jgi:hypothetical protein
VAIPDHRRSATRLLRRLRISRRRSLPPSPTSTRKASCHGPSPTPAHDSNIRAINDHLPQWPASCQEEEHSRKGTNEPRIRRSRRRRVDLPVDALQHVVTDACDVVYHDEPVRCGHQRESRSFPGSGFPTKGGQQDEWPGRGIGRCSCDA